MPLQMFYSLVAIAHLKATTCDAFPAPKHAWISGGDGFDFNCAESTGIVTCGILRYTHHYDQSLPPR